MANESAIPTLGLRAVLQQTFAVNAFGVACTTDAFLPLLKKSTSPRVVNVSSSAGSLGVTSKPDYTFRPLMVRPSFLSSKYTVQDIDIYYALGIRGVQIRT